MAEEEGLKKLRTYKTLKITLVLKHTSFYVRKCISAFRISAHKLRTERGRYKTEKPEDILCEECNEVETEVHFCANAKSMKT